MFAKKEKKSSCWYDGGVKGDCFQSEEPIDVSIIRTYALISIWINMAPVFTQPWAEHLTHIGKAASEELPVFAEEDLHRLYCQLAPFDLNNYCQLLELYNLLWNSSLHKMKSGCT